MKIKRAAQVVGSVVVAAPRLALGLLLLGWAVLGCSTAVKKQQAAADLPGRLAIAGFTNPQNTWDLIAGCLPEKCVLVENRQLTRLDAILAETVAATGHSGVVGASALKSCEQVTLHETGGGSRASAVQHWLAVGRCASAEFLLVPQLLYWRELNLPEEQPASVTMDFFLLDVRAERIVNRYHYEETQQPLSSNLLEAGKFFNRKGKWVSAEQLAREGIVKAVEEFRL